MPPSRATIVIDLAFGDCGKGTIVDYLARSAPVHTVVRFNGGPQAGHNVVTPDGRHHTFSQIGSGTLASPSIATLLSRFMVIEPYALRNEVAHLQQLNAGDIWDRLFIDSRCAVITPAHQAANRLREAARGQARHGTCGQGLGETVDDILHHPELTLRAGDLSDSAKVASTLHAVAEHKVGQLRELIPALNDLPIAVNDLNTLRDLRWIEVAVQAYRDVANSASIVSPEGVAQMLNQRGEVLFEGAQGVLLDEDFGFHPHTTWSRTTCANALEVLREAGLEHPPRRIGVLRSYFTRHGRGPFVTEDQRLRAALPEPHNTDAGHQGAFRVGVFDAVAARYAAKVSGVHELAITHLGRLANLPDHICTAYRPARNDPALLGTTISSDLKKREQSTRSLIACNPVFTRIPKDTPQSFTAAIQHQLDLPVTLMSFGPRATDKLAY
jgi:adenylosuccinate synthase